MVDFWNDENTFQNMHNSYFCQLLWSKVFVFAVLSVYIYEVIPSFVFTALFVCGYLKRTVLIPEVGCAEFLMTGTMNLDYII